MKIFEHNNTVVESIKRFNGLNVIGIYACDHFTTCSDRYRNFKEMCSGYMIIVNCGLNGLNPVKLHECPCTEVSNHHLRFKDTIEL